jgi:hypothetical protein
MNYRPLPILTFAAAVGLIVFTSSAEAASIDLSAGTAAQSSQLGGFVATNATDAVINFTHTLNSDPNPTWQVLLGDSYAFNSVEAFNRASSDGTLDCCPSRFRDITIQIVNFVGDPALDFTGGTVTFDSGLLNAENVIGGGTDTSGPVSLAAAPGGAVGNMIRIIRTRDDDLSGSGGLGNADEASVLSMDLVTADGTLIPEPSATLFGLLGLATLALRRRR